MNGLMIFELVTLAGLVWLAALGLQLAVGSAVARHVSDPTAQRFVPVAMRRLTIYDFGHRAAMPASHSLPEEALPLAA